MTRQSPWIASLAAHGIPASRGTATSLHIVLAMNCPESVRAKKGDPHCEQSPTTYDVLGLNPFSWLAVNILFPTSWFKHRMTW